MRCTALLTAAAGIAMGQTPMRELPLPAHLPPETMNTWESFLAELPDDDVAIAHTQGTTIRVSTVTGMGSRIADTLLVSSPDYDYRCFGLYRVADHLVLSAWKSPSFGRNPPIDSSGTALIHLTPRLAPIREIRIPYSGIGGMDDTGNLYDTGPSINLHVRKFGPDGRTIFMKAYDTARFIEGKRVHHYPTRIRILSDGNVYVLGYFTLPGNEFSLHGYAGFVFKMSPEGDSLGFARYPDTLHEDELDFWDVADDGTDVLISGAEDRGKRIFLGKIPFDMRAPIDGKFIRIPGSDWIRGDELAYNREKKRFYLQGVHNTAYLYTFDANRDSLQLLNFDLPAFNDNRGRYNDMLLTRKGTLFLSVHLVEPVHPHVGLPILKTLVDEAPVGLRGHSARRRGVRLKRFRAWPGSYTASGRKLSFGAGIRFGDRARMNGREDAHQASPVR